MMRTPRIDLQHNPDKDTATPKLYALTSRRWWNHQQIHGTRA
jgi:hypothetical protein